MTTPIGSHIRDQAVPPGSASAPVGILDEMRGKFGIRNLIRFAAVALQLALIVLVVRTFDIESSAFLRMLTIAAAGFVVHHFAPSRWRMPIFVGVSLGGIGLVMGWSNAMQIVVLGLVLIALAHVPVAFGRRVVLILGFGGLLAAARVSAIHAPLSAAIWPIFGAMFMFRLIVYLYDLKTRAAPVGFWHATGYFFMLPAVCFPLFPVIDYKTFCRTRYDSDEIRIYQTGASWIFRGIFQLLLYRLVYQHLVVGPESVTSALGAAQFIVTAYLIYLKISGSFHVIVGILHLFGFNLPQTNNKYLLSEGFTDYWRRINIYWKDFLQKVFFNPIYFRLNRKMGPTVSLILATLIAFLATWALHSYQWFWIRGRFPVVWQDIVFWSVMGALVLGNMLYENKYGRQRSLKKVRHSPGSELKLALRTMGTFVVICMSWVVWSSESFGEVRMVVARLAGADARSLAILAGSMAALGVTAVFVARADRRKLGAATGLSKLKAKAPQPIWGDAYHVAASCAAILFVAYAPLVIDVHPAIGNVVDNLKTSQLNARDAKLLDRGYYEDLTNVVRFNSGLGDLYNQKPPNWERCWAMRPVDGYPNYELLPDKHIWFKGAMMSTNRWGMRDRDYDKQKPSGTYRWLLSGASHSMGTGVGDDSVYDNVVEDRLNQEKAANGARYEILNFSVGGYGPVERLADMDQRILDFEADAFICVGIDDLYWAVKNLIDAAQLGLPIPYDYLNGVLRDAGVERSTPPAEATQKLEPRQEEILMWLYGQVVERCRARGMEPIALYIPQPRDYPADMMARMKRQTELAAEAGFTVIDIRDTYAGSDYKKLRITSWDSHPNAVGHGMLADRLYAALVARLNS